MAGIKIHQLKASTLLEVIIAMVIIMIVFVLATGIYTNVVRSSPSVRSQQVRLMSENMILKSIEEQNWDNEWVEMDSLIFEKTVNAYENGPDLFVIEVKASEQGRIVNTSRKVVKWVK